MRFFLLLLFIISPHLKAQDWDKYNSSLLIEVTRESGIYTCSGVAVSRQTILTAAHCLEGKIIKTRVFTEELYDPKKEGWEIRQFELHPSYDPGFSFYQFDIAKIYLKKRLPSFINIYPTHKGINQKGRIIRVGFGKRNGENIRTLVIPILKNINHKNGLLELYDENSFSGDSGGPIFITIDNQIFLIGIHSTLSFGPEGKFSLNPLLSHEGEWISSKSN
jgi:hypothetical protein